MRYYECNLRSITSVAPPKPYGFESHMAKYIESIVFFRNFVNGIFYRLFNRSHSRILSSNILPFSPFLNCNKENSAKMYSWLSMSAFLR